MPRRTRDGDRAPGMSRSPMLCLGCIQPPERILIIRHFRWRRLIHANSSWPIESYIRKFYYLSTSRTSRNVRKRPTVRRGRRCGGIHCRRSPAAGAPEGGETPRPVTSLRCGLPSSPATPGPVADPVRDRCAPARPHVAPPLAAAVMSRRRRGGDAGDGSGSRLDRDASGLGLSGCGMYPVAATP